MQAWIKGLSLDSSLQLGLQMDIEGSEWSVIRDAPRKVLRQFQFMVIEFHGLDRAVHLWDFKTTIQPVFKKLLLDFQVAHLHPNNCCRSVEINGLTMPSVLEVSLVRRDLLSNREQKIYWGEEHDTDNVPTQPHLGLTSWKTLSP